MSFDQSLQSYASVIPYQAQKVLKGCKTSDDVMHTMQNVFDFQVKGAPIYLQDGTKIEQNKAIVSEDGEFFGVVSKNYKMIQNDQVVSLVDQVVDRGGVPLSAGRAGARFYLVFCFGEIDFLGEHYISLLTLSWGHNGKIAVNLSPQYLRLFCQNQIPSLMDGRCASDFLKVSHFGETKVKFEVASNLALALAQSAQAQSEFLTELAGKPFRQSDLEKLALLAGVGKKDSENLINRYFESDLAKPLNPRLRGTRYHALQAFTAWGSHTGSDHSKLAGSRVASVRRAAWLLQKMEDVNEYPTFDIDITP